MFRKTLISALALGAQLAYAQAPAAAPAAQARPPQPAMCAACHKLEANQVGG